VCENDRHRERACYMLHTNATSIDLMHMCMQAKTKQKLAMHMVDSLFLKHTHNLILNRIKYKCMYIHAGCN